MVICEESYLMGVTLRMTYSFHTEISLFAVYARLPEILLIIDVIAYGVRTIYIHYFEEKETAKENQVQIEGKKEEKKEECNNTGKQLHEVKVEQHDVHNNNKEHHHHKGKGHPHANNKV